MGFSAWLFHWSWGGQFQNTLQQKDMEYLVSILTVER